MNYRARLAGVPKVNYNVDNHQLNISASNARHKQKIETLQLDEPWACPVHPPNVNRLQSDDNHDFWVVETTGIEKIDNKPYFVQTVVDNNGIHSNVPVSIKEVPWESVSDLMGSLFAEITPEWIPASFSNKYLLPGTATIPYGDDINELFWHVPEEDDNTGPFLVRLVRTRQHIFVGELSGEYFIVPANRNQRINRGWAHRNTLMACTDRQLPPDVSNFDVSIENKLLYEMRRATVCYIICTNM